MSAKKTALQLPFFLSVLVLFLCTAKAPAQETSRPIVRQLSAVPVSVTRIELRWKLPKDEQASQLVIYRDTRPIITKAQIDAATPVAVITGKANYYVDTVKTYKAYYYAVLAKDSAGTLCDIVLPSINATVTAVRVERTQKTTLSDPELEEEKRYADGQKREVPLPYLNMLHNQDKKPNKLKKEVLQAGRELSAGYSEPHHQKLVPHIFDEDMISPAGGDEYYLFEILKTSFIRRDYASSVKALQTFLSVNRSKQVTVRAAFYLGEALYYCERYQQALMMFLYVEEDEPALAKKWLQSTLDLYELPAGE